MPDEGDRWDRLIQGLRAGDAQVLNEFCNGYGPLLQEVAQRHLPADVRRRVGAEDVVQSVCRTFLRRAQAGEFQLADSDGLWRLLCAMTLTKVREQARFHRRRRRGLDREVSLSAEAEVSFDPVDSQPSPAEAAAFADQFQQLIVSLDEDERRLVDCKLQQCTNLETAARMGCSERTVHRILKRVQARLERLLAE